MMFWILIFTALAVAGIAVTWWVFSRIPRRQRPVSRDAAEQAQPRWRRLVVEPRSEERS